MPEKNKIIVILGPTASGKSDIAVRLARKFNGEVISADSRQVYKGLNIGTGKITKKEMRGVKHHLLDVVSLSRLKSGQAKQFTASEFVNLTNSTAVQIVKSGKIPIICGGTGFYIDAFLGEKQIPEVPPNLKLREKLEKKTTEELFEMLKKLDPVRAANIDAKNPRRLIRAIEICKALGSVPKQIRNPKSEIRNPEQKQASNGAGKFEIIKIGIKIPDKKLKEKINKRIEKWFKQGILKEVKDLHKKGLSWKRMSEIGLEYKIVSEYLQKNISKNEMIERMNTETWQYAKRQTRWWKHDKDTNWFNLKQIAQIEKLAKNFCG